MRIKIEGNLIENLDKDRSSYNHELYCMYLNNMPQETAKKFHEKKKMRRPFTFTNLYVENDLVHMYFGSTEEITMEVAKSLSMNRIVKVGDKVIYITKIIPLDELKKQDKYLFKVRATASLKNKDNKTWLPEEMNQFKQCLIKNTINKYKEIYGKEPEEGINIDILNHKKVFVRYKNMHINAHNCIIKITGNYELVNMIYNIGLGEKCSSGFGFMWEV